MAQARFFSSTAQPTQLTANISNATTSLPLAATTGLPVQFPFTLAVDYGNSLEELCDVISLSGLNANVTRAVDGTTASSHSIGAPVRHVSSARDFNGLYIHVGSTSGVHGVTGNLVGDTDTQTLVNKTLTSPVINNPTVNGATVFTASSPSLIPLVVKGAASQTADIFQVQNNTAAVMASVSATGRLTVAPTNTAAASVVVNGPSGLTGDLQDWQVNGVTLASVKSDGSVSLAPTGVTAGEKYLQVNSPSGAAVNNQVINLSANGTQLFDVDVLGKSQLSPIDTTASDLWKVNSSAGTNASAVLMRAQNNGSDRFIVGAGGTWTLGQPGATLTSDNLGNVTASGSLAGLNMTSTSGTYTPTVSGGGLTPGSATINGTYNRAGGIVTVSIYVTMAANSVVNASGALTFSLPGAVPQPNSNTPANGAGYYTKTSGGAFNLSAVTANSAGVNFFLVRQTDLTYLSFNSGQGAAVANGSTLSATVTYNI